MARRATRRGSMLIVVLGVLVLLALLATTFVTLQSTERRITKNYTDDVRAKLLAQSGVDRVIMELKANPSASYLKYWGNDVNENGTVDPGEVQDWNGNNTIDPDEQQIWTAPLEWCKNPSLAVEAVGSPTGAMETPQNPTDANVFPKLINILHHNGTVRQVGVSGFMSTGTYAPYGDVYSVKVNDISGRIYVNDGCFQYQGNYSTVSLNLARILNLLGKNPAVNVSQATCKVHNTTEPVGTALVHSRPPGGYRSKFDLQKVLGDNFRKLEPYITPYAWVDKNVVNPVPLSAQMKPQYPLTYYRTAPGVAGTPVVGGELFRRGRGMNSAWQYRFASEPLMWYQPGNTNEHHNAIYALDELFPGYIEVVWRAPVNVNTASLPVLTALIEDISGFFVMERRRFTPHAPSAPNFGYSGPGFSGSPISFTVPQKYYTWEWAGMTFDAQGFGSDEYGHLYRTRSIKSPWNTGTGVSGETPLNPQVIATHIEKCRSRGTATTTTDGITKTINYANYPWAGEFRSWHQFYRFIDNLVTSEVIRDNRPIFYDYLYPGWAGSNPSSGNWDPPAQQKVPSVAQQRFAAFAIGDALKANFNPNLHLNETNPDANLYLRVDKTDLIVNSTEFCFTPMGYFEIESLGRVLKPQESGPTGGGGTGIAGSGTTSALASSGNHIIAEKKIVVVAKLYDAYRETSQRHFYQGTIFPKGSSAETNSNRAIEIGPEVDNGIVQTMVGSVPAWTYGDTFMGYTAELKRFVDGYAGYPPGVDKIITGWGYEYDGYIALSTYGGCGVDKPKGSLWTTPAGGGHGPTSSIFGFEGMHAHFAWDFKCHFHRSALTHGDSFRDEVGSVTRSASAYIDQIPYMRPPKIERTYCFNDDMSEPLGPYCTAYSPKYRIARSFRLPPNLAGTSETITIGSPPQLYPYAPSDLRLDGAYSERHSAICYWIDEGVSWGTYGGLVAAWIKPSFFPEHTGKIRKIFGFGNWHKKNYNHRNPYNYDLFFFPAHDKGLNSYPYPASSTENSAMTYQGKPYSTGNDAPVEATNGKGYYAVRPASLMAIHNQSCFDGSLADWNDEGPWVEYEIATNTPSLNHNLHPDGLDTGSSHWNGTTTSPKPNPMEAHKWMHVMWRTYIAKEGYRQTSAHWTEIYVNGQYLAGTSPTYAGSIFSSSSRIPIHGLHSLADGTGKWRANVIRLGEASYHGFGWSNASFPYAFMRNSSSDATYDEFYVFRSAQASDGTRANELNTILSGALNLWKQGRYYRPTTSMATGSSMTDALFESAPIYFKNLASSKYLPPPSGITPPPSGSSETTTGVSISVPPQKIRLLGVSWTWYPEGHDGATGVPVMYDWRTTQLTTWTEAGQTKGKVTGIPLKQQWISGSSVFGLPCARVWLYVYSSSGTLKKKFPDATQTADNGQGQIGSSVFGFQGGFTNEYYSKVFDPATGQFYYELEDGDYVKYRVGFYINGMDLLNTILLATPVFDDITIFYSQGDIEFLMWIPVNITT